MPSLSQIIPSYTVPHVQTYINDNSTVNDVVAEPVETGTRLLCVFASPKGEDGVIKTMHSVTEFLDEYGTPNFSLYGQAAHNAYAALSTGNAICHCMRIAPSTAAYASLAICAKAKVDSTTAKLQLKFTAIAIQDDGNSLTNKAALSAALTDLNGTDDTAGFTIYPLFGVVAKGRGIYGNSLSIRLSKDTISNAENNFMNYVLDVIDSSTGVAIHKEELRGAFYEDAIVDSTSLLFDDVVSDPDTGSSFIELFTYHDGWNDLIGLYNTDGTLNVDDSEKINITNADIFTGTFKNGVAIDKITMLTPIASDNEVILNTTTGVKLAGGTDSTFGADQPDASRATAMNAEYIEAFTHTTTGGLPSTRYDKAILSKRRTPADLALDAGFDETVKTALVTLGKARYDARFVLDAGADEKTYTQAINSFDLLNADDFIFSKECQTYKIRDPFTGKIIRVTSTYFIALNLPTHYETIGKHIPFVGSEYTTLTGHIRNSLVPVIDADDLDVKEELYKNKINFFECIAEDTYVRGTQSTAQLVTSDLSEENNVAVLLEMKRTLEEYVSGRLYDFAEAEDRVLFTRDADDLFNTYRGTQVRDYNVYFDMNAFEEARNILHCYLAVTFRTLAKRGIIEIDINKRA